MEPKQGTSEVQGAQGVPNEHTTDLALTEPMVETTTEASVAVNTLNSDASQFVSGAEMVQESATNESTRVDMSQGASEKKVNKMLIGMIALAVVAVCGIGFGIWAMINGNSQKEQYESKISTLNKQNDELKKELEDSGTVVVVDDAIDEEDESESEPVKSENTASYIYVGEWGLKIKIPTSLTSVGYEFVRDSKSTSVNFFGAKKRSDDGDFPDFANMNKNTIPLGTVARYIKGTELPAASAPEWVFSDDQYDYYYSHPQSVYSSTEDDSNWEIDSVDEVKDMLKNKDNYIDF